MNENKIEALKEQIETFSQGTEINLIFAEKVGMRNKYIFKIGDIEVFENKTLLETNKYIVFYKKKSPQALFYFSMYFHFPFSKPSKVHSPTLSLLR